MTDIIDIIEKKSLVGSVGFDQKIECGSLIDPSSVLEHSSVLPEPEIIQSKPDPVIIKPEVKKIKNAKKINKDPDSYIEDISTSKLKKLRDLAADLYYNNGDSGITDNSYDAIEWHLRKRLKKEYSKIETIGATPIERIRIDLPYSMPSLNKVYPDDYVYYGFLKDMPTKGLVWSEKLDGVSGMVVYKDGKPINLYTRGDGVIGGDVKYFIEFIKSSLPDIEYKGVVAIRGEFVIKKDVFKLKYRDLYSNGRSFVVSQINKGFVTDVVKDIDFVTYELIYHEERSQISPKKAMGLLKGYKFKVVRHGLFESNVRMMDITLKYKTRRNDSKYDIDGLVLDYNSKRKIQNVLTNPTYKIAFKMLFKEHLRDSVITDVEWDISRHGRYNPVAIYKPVYINRVRISRATAHNAGHIQQLYMGVGTKVKVTRSGDVIPQIKNVIVDETITPIYPSDYKWHWKGRDIVLDDIENNPRVQQKRILYFFKFLKVPRIGEKTAEYMHDAGFDTIKKIVRSTPKGLTKVHRVGIKTAETIREGISNSIENTPIDHVMSAFTVTNFRIGRLIMKEVFRTFPGILDSSKTEREIKDLLTKKKVRGVGPARIQMISENLPKFREMLMDLDEKGFLKAIKKQNKIAKKLKKDGYDQKIEYNNFVFSGFSSDTPYYLQDRIFNNFGELKTSVNEDTDFLIVKSAMYITPKVLSAQNHNVPIYTIKEFEDYLKT